MQQIPRESFANPLTVKKHIWNLNIVEASCPLASWISGDPTPLIKGGLSQCILEYFHLPYTSTKKRSLHCQNHYYFSHISILVHFHSKIWWYSHFPRYTRCLTATYEDILWRNSRSAFVLLCSILKVVQIKSVLFDFQLLTAQQVRFS